MLPVNDSPLEHPLIHCILSVAYLFVFLSTIIGNVVILLVFLCHRSARSVPNFFLANLTVADLFVGIFCVLQNAAHFVLLASAVMNIPYYFASQYIEFNDGNETLSICTRRHMEINNMNVLKLVTTINFIIWYAVPLLVLLFIYATIGVVVSRASVITKASVSKLLPRGSEKSTQGWKSKSSTGGVSVEKRRKVGRLAFGIVLSFALFSLPRYVYLMWSVWRDPMVPRCLNCVQSVLQPISFLLLFLNSATNPFLYAFLSVRFRQCIKDIFGCKRKGLDNAIELSSKVNRRKTANSEGETAYIDIH
uniref:G_PROTEIN_RECEP_F1_2 domain-containing protein n=1 Tax=Heterorhabditis bacteriophora TaxID=37862 RepID=A0A1I7WPH7_HETBA